MTTRPDLDTLLRTPAARRARRHATRLAATLAGHARLALLATLALAVAAITGLTAAVFALAALVRGLEQLLPRWAAYATTAALLLLCAGTAAIVCAWALLRTRRPAR
ncbi:MULTISPECIES: hypothetical protein [unclassified Nocardia]|uniref:hypothetical protein n=1 Tax=Nocardia sp. NPDC056064 TaxID=3345701 RepID=UPI0035E23231